MTGKVVRGLIAAFCTVLLSAGAGGGAGKLAVHLKSPSRVTVVSGSGVASATSIKRLLIRKRIRNLCGTIGAAAARDLLPSPGDLEVENPTDGRVTAQATCSIGSGADSDADADMASLDIAVIWYGGSPEVGRRSCENHGKTELGDATKAGDLEITRLPELGKYGFVLGGSPLLGFVGVRLQGCIGSINTDISYVLKADQDRGRSRSGAPTTSALLRLARTVVGKLTA